MSILNPQSPAFKRITQVALILLIGSYLALPKDGFKSYRCEPRPSSWHEYTYLYAHRCPPRAEFRHDVSLRLGKMLPLDVTDIESFLQNAEYQVFNIVFGLSSWLVMLLSTYQITQIFEMAQPLLLHLRLVHKLDGYNNKHGEDKYRLRIKGNLRAQDLVVASWIVCLVSWALSVLWMLSPDSSEYCITYHASHLGKILLSRYTSHPLCLLHFEHIIGIILVQNAGWKPMILHVLCYGSHVFIQRRISDKLINDLPCTICEHENQDMRRVRVPQSERVGEYDVDHCLLCLEDFIAGEDVSILGCGHVYDVQCLNDWFQRAESKICPLCGFQVLRNDGEVEDQPTFQRPYLSIAEIERLLGKWRELNGNA